MKIVNGGNFVGCFYVIWNLYMCLERRRKAMYEKIREIYIEQARDREEDEVSVCLLYTSTDLGLPQRQQPKSLR